MNEERKVAGIYIIVKEQEDIVQVYYSVIN